MNIFDKMNAQSATIEQEENKAKYLNKKIRIIHMEDTLSGERYKGKSGVVEYVDSLGQLHGTWGSIAVIPDEDEFEIVD